MFGIKKRSISQIQGNVIFKTLCICNTNEDVGIFLREAPKKCVATLSISALFILGRLRSCQDGLFNHLLELPKTFDAEDQSDEGMSLDSSLFPDKENYELG